MKRRTAQYHPGRRPEAFWRTAPGVPAALRSRPEAPPAEVILAILVPARVTLAVRERLTSYREATDAVRDARRDWLLRNGTPADGRAIRGWRERFKNDAGDR